MPSSIYLWFMKEATGDPFDNHCLASVIAARCCDDGEPLPAALGLTSTALAGLLSTRFPSANCHSGQATGFQSGSRVAVTVSSSGLHCESGHSGGRVVWPAVFQPGLEARPEAVYDLDEEAEEIWRLLMEHRDEDCPEGMLFAAIVARTVLRPNHLWEDFGLRNRGEMSQLLHNHFPRLAQKNAGNKMRWKKFFYKQLCEKSGLNLCRVPHCEACDEYQVCFGTEQTEQDMAGGVVWNSLQARAAGATSNASLETGHGKVDSNQTEFTRFQSTLP